ncbi:MAG: FAD:protein FMN transferase [Pseudomonadota bacterium]
MKHKVKHELRAASGGDYWIGRFDAMASPCELLLEIHDHKKAQRLLEIAVYEAQRIEEKYSRYLEGNTIYHINHDGKTVDVDDETARLLDYADQLYHLSDGLFDITAGVLRRVWHFDPGCPFPSQVEIENCLPQIGWHKAGWKSPFITLPAGMEIDLGGIGKEYAVDRTASLLATETDASFVINFGGDLFVNKPRANGSPWQIAIDDPAASGEKSVGSIAINSGALATSGDARRHLLHQGRRYGHILNPHTGWPVENTPHSISVHAPSCMEAGMLATIAMLYGEGAEPFLQAQGLPYWIID